MIKDLDYSFIRLRDNYAEACDTSFSPAVELSYAGYGIHLIPGETYFQISNSPTNINLETYEVHVLNTCGEVLEEITAYIFIQGFTDSNGIKQIAWEWVCGQDYPQGVISLRFTDTGSGNFYYTNYFNCSKYDSELTARFEYKSSNPHYGTQYDRADFYQAIRIKAIYNNLLNESERNEYHQISTDITVDTRNIRKIKERYYLEALDDWTILRLETLLTNEEVYIDAYRKYSTTPIEMVERELDSDISEKEFIVNPDYSQEFTYEWQIFEGIDVVEYIPFGTYSSGTQIPKYGVNYNAPVTLNTGSGKKITVYDASDDSVLVTYDVDDFGVVAMTTLRNDAAGTPGEYPADGNYYVHMDEEFAYILGIPNEEISDSVTWVFQLTGGEYEETEYNNDEYLT